MKGLENIIKIRAYCDYVEEHLVNVEKAWAILKEACKDMQFSYLYSCIDIMVQEHDVSKMSVEEFIPYQEFFYPVGVKKPEEFKLAWEHHKDNNPHHWENWTKREARYPGELTCNCVCMVIDWMAMGMRFGDTAEKYYEMNSHKIILPGWAIALISEIFEHLRPGKEALYGNGERGTELA